MIQKLTIGLLKNFAPICAVGAVAYYNKFRNKEKDKEQPFQTMFMQRTFEVLAYSFIKGHVENKLMRFASSYLTSICLTKYFSNGYKTWENIFTFSTVSILTESGLHAITGKKFLGDFFAPRLVKVLMELKLVK